MYTVVRNIKGEYLIVNGQGSPANLFDEEEVGLRHLPSKVCQRFGLNPDESTRATFLPHRLPADHRQDYGDAFRIRQVPLALAELVDTQIEFIKALTS